MAKNKKWKDLSGGQKTFLVVLVAIQLALTGAAHADIAKRDERELTASKRAWRLISLIDFAGPLTYFLAGRRL
ncbi:hypothetical protein ACSAGD_13125 [Paramicrobacterium sp. CJ85]|uniref:hypothetical protein n=1 Tax=Paramicrobacterium sp. CJ85 TaxID=3445355 RepID=UPI003F62B404